MPDMNAADEKDSDEYRNAINRFLEPKLLELQNRLSTLSLCFEQFSGKMEIYNSLEAATKVRLYVSIDAAVLDGWRTDIDLVSLIENMRTASAQARDAVASFIRDSYNVDQHEDGT